MRPEYKHKKYAKEARGGTHIEEDNVGGFSRGLGWAKWRICMNAGQWVMSPGHLSSLKAKETEKGV